MATAERNLEEELSTLKAGLETLRREISALAATFGDAATDEIRARGRRARGAVERATDRAGEVWDDATSEASRRGREGVAALERQIDERPFLTVLLAFGIGLVIARLIKG